MTDKQPTFEISPDTRKLVEFLHDRDSVTYTEMSQRIGRKVNGRDRYVLESARRVLQRESGIVFVVQHNVGLKRATNGQIAELSTDHNHQKIKRTNRRGKKLQVLVNTQELTADQRDAFFIGAAVTQMLDATLGRKMRSKIAQEIEERGGEQVNVQDVVALFRKRAH